MTVFRYGHLRSAPVVVDACLRTEWEPPTLRAALSVSTRFGASSMAFCLSVDAHKGLHFVAVQNIATCFQFRSRTSRVMQSAVHVPEVTGPEVRERCRTSGSIDLRAVQSTAVSCLTECTAHVTATVTAEDY